MPNEPRWLPIAEIVALNKFLVEQTGEPFGVRDQGLLESAGDRPLNHWLYGEGDIVVLATALLVGLAFNHPFVQGNKRTAFVAADMLLRLNGRKINPALDGDTLADAVLALLAHTMSEAEFVSFVEPHVITA